MRDFHLRFCESRWYDGLADLLADSHSFPACSGAYVLGTSGETHLVYPWGRSPVYYIGTATNLAQRLSRHRKYVLQAREDHERLWWWPRYQYGAAFGADVAWYSTRGPQNPHRLEANLIEDFYLRHGAIPVANGSWPTGLKKPTKGSRDDR